MTIPELHQGTAAGRIEEICLRYRIRELAIFGSMARAEARSDSDIDLYVEF